MLEDNTKVKVMNRGLGTVGYKIPDLNLRREFDSKEEKEITMEELRKLAFIPGGISLLQNNLVIKNEDAAKEILPNVEPEYFYTEEDVKNLLINGSLDALLDCLDFAPEGTLELIKKVAVNIELNDVQKRQVIQNTLGFNITNAIENSRNDEEVQPEIKERRVAAKSVTTSTGRRTTPTTNKYKIVDKK